MAPLSRLVGTLRALVEAKKGSKAERLKRTESPEGGDGFSFLDSAGPSFSCFSRLMVFVLVVAAGVGNGSPRVEAAEFGVRDGLVVTGVGAGVGAVLGASTLPFYGSPEDHLDNVLIGAGAGLLAGVALSVYLLATPPSDPQEPLALGGEDRDPRDRERRGWGMASAGSRSLAPNGVQRAPEKAWNRISSLDFRESPWTRSNGFRAAPSLFSVRLLRVVF